MSQLVYYKVETEKNYNSLIQVPKLIKYVQSRNWKAIGVSDVQAMYSVMDLDSQARKSGLKPIISVQFKVIGRTKEEFIFVTLVAKNYIGFLEMVELLNQVNLPLEKELQTKKNTDNSKKHVKIKDFPTMENVVATISINQYVKDDRIVFVQGLINKVGQKVGKQNTWVELEPALNSSELKNQQKVAHYAEQNEMKIIASPTVRYFDKSSKKTMSVLEGLKKKKNVMKTDALYGHFLTEEEEKKAYEKFPAAIQQTIQLSEMCNVVFPLKGTDAYKKKMPEFEVDKSFVIPSKLMDMFEPNEKFVMPSDEKKVRQIAYLCALAWKNFLKIYKDHAKKTEISLRLKKELGTIISHDFTNYFLNVQDFMQYARENGITTGPGRGSAAGSLLARCLDIITVDPIEHNLLFERFLNEYRLDEPDIDIDVSKRNRYRLFQYAREKYGIYRVAKIVTFNPYGAKKSLEYVGKAYEMPSNLINKLKTKISKKEGRIEEVLADKEVLAEVTEKFPKCMEVLKIAQVIQEMPESRGNHAAGMVLSENDIRTELPLIYSYDDELGEMIPVIQFTKDSKRLENLGFTKIDFLFLRTLDVIDDAKKMIFDRKGIDLSSISLEDEKVYELFQSGHLIGVFQLDSEKMRKTAVSTKPKSFRDIINLVALYRPGAMDEIDNYVANKKESNRLVYDVSGVPIQGVEELEKILYRTYGIIFIKNK